MLRIGEESGSLDETLSVTNDFYSEELNIKIEKAMKSVSNGICNEIDKEIISEIIRSYKYDNATPNIEYSLDINTEKRVIQYNIDITDFDITLTYEWDYSCKMDADVCTEYERYTARFSKEDSDIIILELFGKDKECVGSYKLTLIDID